MNTMIRATAAAAATVLMTVGSTGPALAGHEKAGAAQGNEGRSSAHAKSEGAKGSGTKGQGASKGAKRNGASEGAKGNGASRGNGHTPVTVCHLLGNGSYNLLTFDANALEAHRNHGDVDPLPDGSCPEAADESAAKGDAEHDHGSNGNGHTPVTVCHLLGNGSYNLLTFDDSALQAHLNHGDILATSDGCPAGAEVAGDTTSPGATPGALPEGDDAVVGGVQENVTAAQPGDGQILGVQENVTAAQPGEGQVLGLQGFAGSGRVPAALAPVAGILPQTGAGQLMLAALVAGLGLLGAGMAMVMRRKTQGSL